MNTNGIIKSRKWMPWLALLAIPCMASPGFAHKAPPLSPAQSNPVTMQMMVGFPPPPKLQVTERRAYRFPYTRWSFHHMRRFYPSANIWRGPTGHVSTLKKAPYPVRDITFTNTRGQQVSIGDWLKGSYTDAFIVLHNGKIAYQYYAPGMSAHQPHLLMSVSKSLLGLIAADLIETGKINPDALVPTYIPELKHSGWGYATVQQTLDMTAPIQFNEQYTDLKHSDIVHYGIAAGLMAPPPGYQGPTNLYAFLPTLKRDKDQKPGQFVYRTVNPEVAAWLVERVTGKPLNQLISQMIWQPMGAEFNAYDLVDPHAMPLGGGQLSVALRDLARFGQMVLQHGKYNGHQILDPQAYQDLFVHDYPVKVQHEGSGRSHYRYHDYWWLANNADHVIEGWGANGQLLHINPADDTVIVKFSSQPTVSNSSRSAEAERAMTAIDAALAAAN